MTGDNDITMLCTYFASLTCFQDDILKVSSYLPDQESKIDRKMNHFDEEKKTKQLNSAKERREGLEAFQTS